MFEESASEIPTSIWASMSNWFTPTVLFLLLNIVILTIFFTSTFANQIHNQNQNQNQNQTQNDTSPKIARSPSLLQRIKSANFYPHHTSHRTQDSDTLFNLNHSQNPETQSHYFFEETHELNHQEIETQFVFEQKDPILNGFNPAHESNHQEIETQFVFEQKDPILDGFNPAHEEKVQEEEDEMQSMEEVFSQVTGGHFSRTKSDTEPTAGELPTKLPARMRKSASMKSPFGHFEEESIVEVRRPATVREKGNAKVTDGDEEVDAKADDFINKFKQQLKLQRVDSIIRYKDMIGRGSGGGR
ncbi:hypothetical protein ABFS83_05G140000 [Erythranthe nasuta]